MNIALTWLAADKYFERALESVAWFNNHRLLESIGCIPPAEAEANYYRQRASQATEVTA